MIERTHREYRDVLRRLELRPSAVLEVGARPDSTCLLGVDELAAATLRVGVNLSEYGRVGDSAILAMDACRLAFDDDTFDLVLCASTLEHVPEFWLAAGEMKRVLAPGGTLLLSVPGYGDSTLGNRLRQFGFRTHMPDWWKRATLTMRVHDAPHDYYRFSRYALEKVVLEGLTNIRTWSILSPPRLYAAGLKPAVCPK